MNILSLHTYLGAIGYHHLRKIYSIEMYEDPSSWKRLKMTRNLVTGSGPFSSRPERGRHPCKPVCRCDNPFEKGSRAVSRAKISRIPRPLEVHSRNMVITLILVDHIQQLHTEALPWYQEIFLSVQNEQRPLYVMVECTILVHRAISTPMQIKISPISIGTFASSRCTPN